jgi:hypothetical protein
MMTGSLCRGITITHPTGIKLFDLSSPFELWACTPWDSHNTKWKKVVPKRGRMVVS